MPAPQPVGRWESVIWLGGFGSPCGCSPDAHACVQLDLKPSRPRRGLGFGHVFLWASAATANKSRCSAVCSEPGDTLASSGLLGQRNLPQDHAEMQCPPLGFSAWNWDKGQPRAGHSSPGLCPRSPHFWVPAGSLQAEDPQHRHPGSGGLSTPSNSTECLALAS